MLMAVNGALALLPILKASPPQGLSMQPDWILIANASRARVLQQQQGRRLAELKIFEHPESRLHSSELGDDPRGRQRRDGLYGAAAFEPHLSAQRKEHVRFAHELAGYLETAAQQGLYRSLQVFAGSPFLGELKAELGDATRRLLAGCHDLDLSSVGPAELGRRIEHALAQAG
jgi:protein required for attachment to host cells